ncbi:HEAT repeat domain-containing protein [Anatilimnocola floriformis]|uniref:HEAT repeat domain-containing protein n=1 Tax=Anatilimnocola floriformis TaxID=2948575 RepID=UPI0020C225EE|nr:HEAT repeat domain-containing protein [Anatilimnocola floriformis]
MAVFAGYNPWITKDWKEDEKYATTYHTKVTQLAELRERAPKMPPAEQERLSTELAVEVQREKTIPMRIEIVKTLSAFPTPQARSAIQLAATDPDPYVRRESCVALAKNPDAEALQVLSHTLANDTDTDVKIVAARSLSKFKDQQAAQALAGVVDDNNPALQQTAMDSLRTVTGKDYGYSAKAWREFMQGGSPTPPPPPSIAQRLREDWWWW